MLIRILVFIAGLVLLYGCGSPYFKQGMKYENSFKNLLGADTLKLSNYLVYSFVTRSAPFYPVTEQFLNSDSIIEKLRIAFENNAIPINAQTITGINYRDSMKMHRLIRFGNIDEDLISRASDIEGYILFPVISFTNEVHFGGYMTANAMAGSGEFKHYSYLNILLYIIKEKEIIYKSHMRYLSDRFFISSFEEGYKLKSGLSIKQEHWDELVRRTMRGYFKQVGR
jgi:hypothetical protein